MKITDPVCKMAIEEKDAAATTSYKGKTYRFCSSHCKESFDSNPESYLGETADVGKKEQAEVSTKAEWTCPMHPEIRQDYPSNCPKCGMTLEPVMPSLENEENPELLDFQHRFWWTLPLTGIVFVLAMFGHRLQWMDMAVQSWVELALATPIVVWAGWPFFVRGWQSLLTRNLNMFTLIALGTGVAWLYSVVALFAPQVFPPAFRDHHGAVAAYLCLLYTSAAADDPLCVELGGRSLL